MRLLHFSVVFVIFLAYSSAARGQSEQDDESFLRTQARIPTDDASLISFLQKRVQCETAEGMQKLIRRLGSGAYAEREAASKLVVLFGSVTLPELRKHTNGEDTELSRRAKACLKEIEAEPDLDWECAIVRLLERRKASGAIEALLDFLTCVNDPQLEEQIYYAVEGFCFEEVPAPIFAALENANEKKRAVAACIIGRRGNAEQRTAIRNILKREKNALVRLRGAQGLLAAGDTAATPILIDLLNAPTVVVGWQAEELLRWSVSKPPEVILGAGSDESKRKCHEAWRAWWREHGEDFRIDDKHYPGGPCLVLAWGSKWEGGGWNERVFLLGSDGSQRYQMSAKQGPLALAGLLPGDQLLMIHSAVPRNNEATIVIRDFSGATVHHFALRMDPDSWMQLRNEEWQFRRGRSVVVCNTNGKILRSKNYDAQRPVFGRLPNEPKVQRDGSKLVCIVDEENLELGTRARRTMPDNRVVWEGFLDCTNARVAQVLPLVQFGFSPTGRVDTVVYRTRLLQSGNVLERRNAIHDLKKLPMDDAVFQATVKAIRDTDYTVRRGAIILASKSPVRCEKVIGDFVGALTRTGDSALDLVFKGIGEKKSIAVVLEALNRESDAVRRQNVLGLLARVYLGQSDEVTGILKRVLANEDKEFRKTVLVSIRGNPNAKVLLAELIDAVGDSETGVAWEAISDLSVLGPDASPAVPALLKAMNKEPLRRLVVGTFAYVGTDNDDVLKSLLGCLRDDEPSDIVVDAIEAIAKRGKHAKNAVKPLIQLLNNKWAGQEGVRIQTKAALALGAIGPEAKGALEPLIKIVLADNVATNREILVGAIGRIDSATQAELIQKLGPRVSVRPLDIRPPVEIDK